MDAEKSCPMAFFTPIITIDEAPPNKDIITKEKSPKTNITDIKVKKEDDDIEDVKKEDISLEECEIKIEPKRETKDPVVAKRRRGRPKKTEAVTKPVKKRKYTRRTKEPEEKKVRKKRILGPKKGNPKKVSTEGRDEDEVKYDEDLLISPEHLDENKAQKCPICKDDKERNLKELREHYKKEHPGKRLRTSRFFGDLHPCDICGKEFKSTTSLKDHVETHNNYFYCDICNHSTKKILEHVVHLRIHSDFGIFQCLMCEFNTLEINKINDHVNHHDDLLKYWCDSCKKSFQILQHFQEHDNFHTGLKPFDCEFCGKCFLYSRFLHAHKLNMHKEDINCPSTYECVICNKIYQHRNSLKLHMNSHTGNFAICDVCGKTLSSKEKLKFHLRTHTGYKPYSCQYCGKCFTKKPILVEHVRVHTGEKPYICDYCTKAFSQRSSLVIHMRGHTGEKPYVCQFCTKGFVAKAMLNIHLKACKGLFQISKTEF